MDKIAIKENVNIARSQVMWARDKSNESISGYSNFLTGAASILFGLSPLVRIYEADKCEKIIFIISLIFVFSSFVMGAVHILFEKKFFDSWLEKYYKIFEKWNEASSEDDRVPNAIDFEEKIYSSSERESSGWPIFFQSMFLFSGFIGLLIVVSISIF